MSIVSKRIENELLKAEGHRLKLTTVKRIFGNNISDEDFSLFVKEVVDSDTAEIKEVNDTKYLILKEQK